MVNALVREIRTLHDTASKNSRFRRAMLEAMGDRQNGSLRIDMRKFNERFHDPQTDSSKDTDPEVLSADNLDASIEFLEKLMPEKTERVEGVEELEEESFMEMMNNLKSSVETYIQAAPDSQSFRDYLLEQKGAGKANEILGKVDGNSTLLYIDFMQPLMKHNYFSELYSLFEANEETDNAMNSILTVLTGHKLDLSKGIDYWLNKVPPGRRETVLAVMDGKLNDSGHFDAEDFSAEPGITSYADVYSTLMEEPALTGLIALDQIQVHDGKRESKTLSRFNKLGNLRFFLRHPPEEFRLKEEPEITDLE